MSTEGIGEAEQLKKLPALIRLYKKKREALYQDEDNEALRRKAEKLGYCTPLKLGIYKSCAVRRCLQANFQLGCVYLQGWTR